MRGVPIGGRGSAWWWLVDNGGAGVRGGCGSCGGGDGSEVSSSGSSDIGEVVVTQ